MIYPSFLANLAAGRISLEEDPFCALLVTSSYLPRKEHKTVADIHGEVQGKGYVAGGTKLTGQEFKDGWFRADNPVWLGATIRGADRVVVYRKGKGNPLVCCYDLPEEGASTNASFEVEWQPEGVVELAIPEE